MPPLLSRRVKTRFRARRLRIGIKRLIGTWTRTVRIGRVVNLDRRRFLDEGPGLAQLVHTQLVIGARLTDALFQLSLYLTFRLRRLILQRFDLCIAFTLDGLDILL